MFGPFRITPSLSGGKLWKIPWRLSAPQKRRQRKRMSLSPSSSPFLPLPAPITIPTQAHQPPRTGLNKVDTVISTLESALAKQGHVSKAIVRWREEMPSEAEMVPRDKYTVFDRKEKRYRKSIRKVPKWTRVSQRVNPPGF